MAYMRAAPELSAVRRDRTVGRAHARAAGAPPNQGRDPALGRSRGDFRSRIHLLADQRGRPLCVSLTSGPRRDRTQARDEAWTGAPLPRLIADRAYDRDASRAWRAPQAIEAVIPTQHRRLNPQSRDPERYPARHAAERGLGWLAHGRRVATRYAPYAHRCLGFLYLAGAWIGMKPKIHTA